MNRDDLRTMLLMVPAACAVLVGLWLAVVYLTATTGAYLDALP